MADKKREKPFTKLKGKVVGCGVQGRECLALALRLRHGRWVVLWGLFGSTDIVEFNRDLKGKVGRRSIWVNVEDPGEGQGVVTRGIDLSMIDRDIRRQKRIAEEKAAVQTQLAAHFGYVGEQAIIQKTEIFWSDGSRHVIGSMAREKVIAAEYEKWTQEVGLKPPHIGSCAAALANLYLALYPADQRRACPNRMVVQIGREEVRAVWLDDWRLIDSVREPILHRQETSAIIQMLLQHFGQNSTGLEPPTPCLLQDEAYDAAPADVEVWRPFGEPSVEMPDSDSRNTVMQHQGLAAMAFGMALQGG